MLLLALLFTPAVLAADAKILVFGDSLAAAYGLNNPQQGWVALLAQRLKEKYPHAQVINASISGETTRGGLSRIDAELARHRPTLVILELGANDGLRGLPVAQAHANLAGVIRAIRKSNAAVILIGLQIPPNYGIEYAREFRDMYPRLASQYKVALVPFLLDGFAEQRDLFQTDGLHPVAAAQVHILENVWPKVNAAMKP